MFDTKDLDAISQEYFNIICTSEYDVTVQSKNTGHFWYLHNVTQPNANACVIFHNRKSSCSYWSIWQGKVPYCSYDIGYADEEGFGSF